jgi:hypothetical protein
VWGTVRKSLRGKEFVASLARDERVAKMRACVTFAPQARFASEHHCSICAFVRQPSSSHVRVPGVRLLSRHTAICHVLCTLSSRIQRTGTPFQVQLDLPQLATMPFVGTFHDQLGQLVV